MNIGAQLYTVRDYCRNTDDLARTLEKVADIGYRFVQLSGTCEFDAAWMKDRLAQNGLSCVITHNPQDKLTGQTQKLIADHDIFGCDCIGLGYYGFAETDESIADFRRIFLPAMRSIRDAGKYFMYHNHDGEFKKIGRETILERLAREIPAELMGFTLDTYWVQRGGGDSAWWLHRLKGRIPCIHLKDYAYGAVMAPIGEGNINFDAVFAAAEEGGTRYMLVEQDDCGGEDPFECLKRSYQYLTACGFN